ncbi:hypothetical protein Chor_010757 [Crotalus horridus]
MGGYFWKTVLVLGALSASGCCAPSHQLLRYDEAVSQGVVLYKSKAEEDSFYRLLEAVPQPEWVCTLPVGSLVYSLRDPNSEGTQELKFTIKETMCPAEKEHSSDECNFKEDGVSDHGQAGLVIDCQLFDPDPGDGEGIRHANPSTSHPSTPKGCMERLNRLSLSKGALEGQRQRVVRECTATYFLQEKPPLAFVTCNAVEGIEEEEEEEKEEEDQPERFKKLKKLFKKIKKGAKKGIKIVTQTGAQIFFKKQILGKIAG